MGRHKIFKEEDALKKAMYLFWEKGYEGVSLKELIDEMGILNGSFYHSYQNKKNLFTKALKFYEDDFEKKRTELFNAKLNFKKKIRILFTHVLDRQSDAVCPRGCFLFNSVSSETIKELDLCKLVQKGIDDFEEFLAVEIKKAIAAKELDSHIDPKVTASILIAYMQGLMKLSVLNFSDKKFRVQSEYFLNSLGI